MTKTWNHFIDGKTVEAETHFSANTPCTGQAGAQVASGTEADVDAAVKAAERALPAWRDCRPIERGRILTAIAAAIRARLDDFAAIERAEGGKPLWRVGEPLPG